jgi:phage shock protein A
MFTGKETRMLRIFLTLFRGAAAAAEEDIADRNALLVLDQQIRDAASAVGRGKHALAIAVVGDERERKRIEALTARIADLEERAVAALAMGRRDLAEKAAETIAGMENDRAGAASVQAELAGEIARLRGIVASSTRRLADLDRGRHIAKAAEAARRLVAGPDAQKIAAGALAEAEATLRRLRERQAEAAALDRITDQLDVEAGRDALVTRLEEAGCGRPSRVTGAEVLARLGTSTRRISADAE